MTNEEYKELIRAIDYATTQSDFRFVLYDLVERVKKLEKEQEQERK